VAGVLLGAIQVWAAPVLKVGDPPPKLQTGKWIQGEPVKGFQNGKAYLVEFWATWCGPCLSSIPHLNDLHNRYKDKGLVVIGQNADGPNDSKVADFVKKMGNKMTYRVALDDKQGSEDGKMVEAWMAAAGQQLIPTAFLVDTKSTLVWIGSPFDLDDHMVENVLADKPIGGKVASK
jgi:thiol-disulfide isomerase/thioredoxin